MSLNSSDIDNCFKKLGQGRKEREEVFTRQSWKGKEGFLFSL